MSYETGSIDPTRATTSQQRMERALVELHPILDAPEDQASLLSQDYVLTKTEELSTQSRAPDTISIDTGPVADFIFPDSRLTPNEYTHKGILLDDSDAYLSSTKFLRATWGRIKDKMPPERALLNAAISAAHYGQAEYFDGYDGDGHHRESVLALTVNDEDDATVSIGELKGGAKCLERAAVAHNILTLYGVTSTLEMGRLTIARPDGTQTTENHALLRITALDGVQVMFDPMNPVFVDRQDGKVDARPSLTPIETDSRQPFSVDLMRHSKVPGEPAERCVAQLTFEFNQPTIE